MMRVEVDIPGRVHAELTAAAGEVLVVIGPNGAGKSTLLRAIAGLEPGGVLVGEEDWTDLEVPRRRVGYVFQDQSLFPHLSALDNVAFGPRARGRSRADAERAARTWLERFGIGDLADRKPRELSGGQAQRVAIARALATDPDVLLLDEPFSGLDVSVQMALRIELGQHLRDFAGIALLVTHDAIDALTLADRVLVLDEGRVAQVGPPAEVASPAPHPPRRAPRRPQPGLRRRRAGGVHPRCGRRLAHRARGLLTPALARHGGERDAARGRRTTAGARRSATCSRTSPRRRPTSSGSPRDRTSGSRSRPPP